MKIKHWLMVSYFVVMLLPVAFLYFLYLSLNHYNEKQDVIEYMEISNKLSSLENVLQDPSLYKLQPASKYKKIKSLTNESLKIILYRPDGIVLFSSLQDPFRIDRKNTNSLYMDLNELQKKLKTYVYKKPVFQNGQLIGIYEVTIARDDWVEEMNHRSALFTGIFIVFFLGTYVFVIYLLNRKLNRPMEFLRAQMTNFARGEPLHEKSPVSKDEMGELIAHFFDMKDQIEKAQQEIAKQQKEKEFMVASLTHDLKTPLTVVQAYSEALLDENRLTEKERQEYETILFEKLKYIRQMLDDLSVYISLQSEQGEMEFTEVDGEEFFDMLLSGYDENCQKSEIFLHTEKNVCNTYYVNVKNMIRIVDNLMSNAIRHTDGGKNIHLAAISSHTPMPSWIFSPFQKEVNEWRKNGTAIIVQNEGEGIPFDKQEMIFEPFVQGEGARGHGGSSGLGLSIAKMLVEKHGGKIKLWSRNGYGTLVVCWLPER